MIKPTISKDPVSTCQSVPSIKICSVVSENVSRSTSSVDHPERRLHVSTVAGKTAQSVANSEFTIDMRCGSSVSMPQIPNTAIINTDRQLITPTSDHPITFNLYSTKSFFKEQTLSHQKETSFKGLNFECKISNCTLDHCKPTQIALPSRFSNYSLWTPHRPPAHDLDLDFSIPLSGYNSNPRLYGQPYKISQNTRSILTHSSYWKYKNKIRFMHDMPSTASVSDGQTSSVSKPCDGPVQSVSFTAPSDSLLVPIQPLVSTSPSMQSTCIDLANQPRPSVITGEMAAKKLIRSQSTPSGDVKSKVNTCLNPSARSYFVSLRIELTANISGSCIFRS